MHHYLTGTLLFLALVLQSSLSDALVFRIRNNPRPLLLLSIGSFSSQIDTVSFNVPAGQLGNGNPVAGNPRIRIIVANRATPNFSRTAVLSVDSSTPMSNGSSVLPFTSISWTSRDNHIPSGRYNGTANQFLLSFPNSFLILDYHRFRYDNSLLLEAGAYTGRVTYTLTMP